MLIFGAVDFTAALARGGEAARLPGDRVRRPRRVRHASQRFPMADEVVNDWPDRYLAEVGAELGPRDAVCVLTHDHKFDVPAIVGALRHRRRLPRRDGLAAHRTTTGSSGCARPGVDDAGLDRIMAPIGLDIGARTPEETAIAICAEIIALRTGRHAPSLRDGVGPIHEEHRWISASAVRRAAVAARRAAASGSAPPPRSPPRACRSRSARAIATRSRPPPGRSASRGAARGRRRDRRGCPRLRRGRHRRARRRRHPRDERGRPAAGHLRVDAARRLPRPRSSSTASR